MKLPKVTQLVISGAKLDPGSLAKEPGFLYSGQISGDSVLMGWESRQKADNHTDKRQLGSQKEMYNDCREQRDRPSLAGGGQASLGGR